MTKKKPIASNEMIEVVISSLFDSFRAAKKSDNPLLMLKISPELRNWLLMRSEMKESVSESNILSNLISKLGK